MDTTKSHGFFLASFLVLMFLGDLTEACRRCPEITLRDACCSADFVMRTEFKSVRMDSYSIMFSILPLQVFKGPGSVRNARVLYSSKGICGYHHRGPLREDDYLIAGFIDKDKIELKKCDFAIPWEDVTLADKMNLNGVAGRDCSNICAHG